jgi:hypothetical protein
MIICHWLIGTYYLMQICIHQLRNNVHVIEVLLLWRSYNIFNGHHLHWRNRSNNLHISTKSLQFLKLNTNKDIRLKSKPEILSKVTFSWSICRRSLISRKVLLASIRLSNALPIFLMATSSRVSAFTAALKEMKNQYCLSNCW